MASNLLTYIQVLAIGLEKKNCSLYSDSYFVRKGVCDCFINLRRCYFFSSPDKNSFDFQLTFLFPVESFTITMSGEKIFKKIKKEKLVGDF